MCILWGVRGHWMKVMKRIAVLALVSSVVATNAISSAIAQSHEEQKMFTAQDIKWSPGPPSLPAGAEVALLYGDAAKEGLFVLRLKVPKGYRVPPHMHPKPEIATVLSGTVRLGMGEKDHVFPAGSFYATPPGMVHHFVADEDTVVQINSTGPWGINYVDAKDDPRQKSQ
jgi:quercetin dioxygenase-like cupin family protein